MESLQKGKKEGGGGSDQFFQTSAVNFLAACIYFFCNYQKRPYDEQGRELAYDKTIDPETGMIKPTGIVRDERAMSVSLPIGWASTATCRISCLSSTRAMIPSSRY